MKKFLIVLLLIHFCQNVNSQTVEFIKSYGNSKTSEAKGITVDKHGNNYTLGTFRDTLDFGNGIRVHTQEGGHLFLVKQDSLGNAIWAKSFGSVGGYSDIATDITIDKDGDIYVLGEVNCWQDLDFGTINMSSDETPEHFNVFVAKFSQSDGACEWLKVNNTNFNYRAFKIVVNNNKSTSIVGHGAYQSEFGDISLPFGNTYIATFDSMGNVVWANSYDAHIMDLYYDSSNNLYCTGYALNDHFDAETMVENSFILSKIDQAGNVIWLANDGFTAKGYSIHGFDDNIYILGDFDETCSFGNYTLYGNDNYDGFLVSYDSSGNVRWAEKIDANIMTGSEFSTTSDIVVNNKEEIFISFQSYNEFNIGNTTLDLSSNNFALAKYNKFGNSLWAIQTYFWGDKFIEKIRTDHHDRLYLAGYFKRTMLIGNSDTLNSTNHSIFDCFISRINTSDITIKEISFNNNIEAHSSNLYNILVPDKFLRFKIRINNPYYSNQLSTPCVITTDNPYVEISDSTSFFSNLYNGTNHWCENEFEIKLDPNIPNNEVVAFKLILKDNENILEPREEDFYIPIVLNPFEIKFCIVDDDSDFGDFSNGNNNNIIEPEETVEIAPLINNTTNNEFFATEGYLYSSYPEINIWNNYQEAFTTVYNHYSYGDFEAYILNKQAEENFVLTSHFSEIYNLPFGVVLAGKMSRFYGNANYKNNEFKKVEYRWGVGFVLNDYYPDNPNAENIDEITERSLISIYPNPTNSKAIVKGSNIEKIDIINARGQVIESLIIEQDEVIVDLSEYSSGVYLFKITTPESIELNKVVIEK